MTHGNATKMEGLRERRSAPLGTPTDLGLGAAKDLGGALNRILADVFALWFFFESTARPDSGGR